MRKLALIISGFTVSACSSPAPADIDDSLNHPVFQSFGNFCLPLIYSEDGYGDENIKKFATLANLNEGILHKGRIRERQPAAQYIYGDTTNGSELDVMRRFATRGMGVDSCASSTFNADILPSASQFTEWLDASDPGWSLAGDTSRNFQHEGKEDVYGTFLTFVKPLSESACFKLTYTSYENIHPPPNPNTVGLAVSYTDVERLCPEPLGNNASPEAPATSRR